jgi:hypothetical protein
MASPKRKEKPKPETAKNPKRKTDREVLRELFPPQVVEYVETQLKESEGDDER